jgi:hypothetical protein
MKTEIYSLNKRIDFVRSILADCAHGHPESLQGLADYLTYDHGYTIERLIHIAHRRFNIPKAFLIKTAINLNLGN